MYNRYLLVLLPALLLLASCNSTGCYEETEVKVRCSFYYLSESEAVSLDSISVWGVGSDSLVYDKETVSELALELNPSASETRYVVQAVASSGYTFIDTLTFLHTNRSWFESMDCDCMVFSTLDTCLTTGTIFQSATISNTDVTNYETTHVVLNI